MPSRPWRKLLTLLVALIVGLLLWRWLQPEPARQQAQTTVNQMERVT